MNPSPRLIIILGNTAGGKSELAVELALRLGGQVIGADSMQVYRHMDAGTAKPSREVRKRVVHHLVDVVEPAERFTVHDWLGHAQPLVEGLLAAGQSPIVVGGTNLYLKALLEGLFDGPKADLAYRASLQDISPQSLHAQLQCVDPQAALRIAPNDRQRLVRALEVQHLTGQPISQWQTQWRENRAGSYRYDPLLVGLRWPTDEINQRINGRVKQMFFPSEGESLPDEAHRLDALGLLGQQAREALGYKQVLTISDPDQAFERTKILTRRFAKQQRTWMRRFREVHWLDVPPWDVAACVDQIVNVQRSQMT